MKELSPTEIIKQGIDKILSDKTLSEEDKKRFINNSIDGYASIMKLIGCLFLMRKAAVVEDEEYRDLLLSVSSEIKDASYLAPLFEKELVECLSEMEHDQWMSWAKSTLSNVEPSIRERWISSFVPYKNLSDSAKALDRVWANKTLDVVGMYFLKHKNEFSIQMINSLKFALEVHSEGQFHPDDFAVYKNSVMREFTDAISSEGMGEGRSSQ